MRNFLTVNGDSSTARPTKNMDATVLYVAEIVADAGCTPLDEDHIECDDADAVRVAVHDLLVPMFCCRSPRRKLPPQTPVEALQRAAAAGKEGLWSGQTVRLNGQEITL